MEQEELKPGCPGAAGLLAAGRASKRRRRASAGWSAAHGWGRRGALPWSKLKRQRKSSQLQR